MADNPFSKGKVTKELVNTVRKTPDKDMTKDEIYAAHKDRRIHMLKQQLKKDRETLSNDYIIVNGSRRPLDPKNKALYAARIRRAINMLDQEYGKSASFDDGFNELIDRKI